MKIGAHPLVVAVALGLLGPIALAEEQEEAPEVGGAASRAHTGAPSERAEAVPSADALSLAVEEVWAEMVDLRVDPA